MHYYLAKTEPGTYSIDDLARDKHTVWDGVTNPQAVKAILAMKKGDKVLFYHSVTGKEVVGIATVSKSEFPDPTDEKWIAVEIKPVEKFAKPVTLEQIKAEKSLENIPLIKHSRLSVMPLTNEEFERIIEMSK